MKYRFLSLLMIIIMVGCAKPSNIFQEIETDQIVHFSEITNVENVSDYVFYLNKGDKIPLQVTFDSDIFDIAREEINVILKQRVFFKLIIPKVINTEHKSTISEEEKQKIFKSIIIYLSPDAKSWAPYTDIRAVEKVFGIKGGSFSIGMGITKEDGIAIFLNAKIN